jgi:hypothetical protein
VNPGIVPIVNAQIQQIDELNSLKACVGDTNENGRCDEPGCQTCADVTPGTPCDGGDFRTVCCAQVNTCIGTPTEWTITFNFRSTPLFDASGNPLPRPTSPVIIQRYTAIFSYSSGCPTSSSYIRCRNRLRLRPGTIRWSEHSIRFPSHTTHNPLHNLLVYPMRV